MSTQSHNLEAQCTMDFIADWRENLAKQVTHLGYPVEPSDDAHALFFKLYNIEQRNVPVIPRKLEISKELTCPADLQPGLDEIKRKVIAGENLRPHLSTQLLKADYQDQLLNDWGILHLHLDAAPHTKLTGFNKRTGPLLFARVTADTFYMIDVKQHGAWSDAGLIEILHANWPRSLDQFRYRTIVSINYAEGRPPTADERQQLRDSGFMIPIELMDGTIYHPTGGGITSAGTSVKATLHHNATMHVLQRLRGRLLRALPTVIQQAADKNIQMNAPFHFRLKGFPQDNVLIVEQNSDVAIILTPEDQ